MLKLFTNTNNPRVNIQRIHFCPSACNSTAQTYICFNINIFYTYKLDRHARGTQGAIAGEKIKIDSDSDSFGFGYALQAGVDVNLKDGWLINADVKYINIEDRKSVV